MESSKELEPVLQLARYLRADGLGPTVQRRLTGILNHDPGECSPLVAFVNATEPGERQRLLRELLQLLGKLYRATKDAERAATINAKDAANVLELLVSDIERSIEKKPSGTTKKRKAKPAEPKKPGVKKAIRLLNQGLTREDVAERTGLDVDYVSQIKGRYSHMLDGEQQPES